MASYSSSWRARSRRSASLEKKPPLSQKGVREARRGRAGSRRGAREKTKSRRNLELREARWSDCVGGEYSAVQYLQACGGWPGRGRAAPGDTWLLGRTAWSVWRSGLLAEAGVPEFEGE